MSLRAVFACLLLPLVVVILRLSWDGRAALDEAAALADRSDLASVRARIAALGRAARRLGGTADSARESLAELARRGTPGAWEELRAAILGTRWLLTPAPQLLDEANRAIAAHRAADKLALTGGTPSDPAQLAAEHEAQLVMLRTTGEPARAAALLAVLGASVFALAIALLAWRGGSPRRMIFGALGFTAMLLGLWRA